ncbi:hypothetical protein BsWGS_01161 [Bradybaena similaris]
MWILVEAVLLMAQFDVTQLVALEPSFDSPMANVTYKEMETAVLPCSVKFLGRHQVVWTDQWSTLLTYEDRRIIDDERLSVERPFTKDWNLHIREVKYKDQGLYNCQINTNPVKIKTVNLKVQVPSKIFNNASADAEIVREGTTVTLICNVSGIPMPTVTWYRLLANEKGEDKKSEFCPGTTRIGISGEVLLIHNVSRYCGGVYECVAFNGVPPAVNKLIRVSVEFPPEIKLPTKRIGQDVGKETILECTITANPQAVGFWKKNGEEMKTVSGKYRIEPYADDEHSITLSLRIMFIDKNDYGTYTCEASNKLGRDTNVMTLFDYSAYRHPLIETTTTTTTTTSAISRTESTSVFLPLPSRHQQQLYQRFHPTAGPEYIQEDHLMRDSRRPNTMSMVNDHVQPRVAASSKSSYTPPLSLKVYWFGLLVVCGGLAKAHTILVLL